MKISNKISFVFLILFGFFVAVSFKPFAEKKTVIIDVSHGGSDFGAQKNGVSEKTIVAEIANKINFFNNNESNLEIILLRNDDTNWSLQERADFINNMNPSLMI